MTEAPRCPKCGKVPPIRRVEGVTRRIEVTYGCTCGERYRIDVSQLEEVDGSEYQKAS